MCEYVCVCVCKYSNSKRVCVSERDIPERQRNEKVERRTEDINRKRSDDEPAFASEMTRQRDKWQSNI